MRIAMLSIHSSPIAALGGKEAGGMNVYVRELSRELGRRGIAVEGIRAVAAGHHGGGTGRALPARPRVAPVPEWREATRRDRTNM